MGPAMCKGVGGKGCSPVRGIWGILSREDLGKHKPLDIFAGSAFLDSICQGVRLIILQVTTVVWSQHWQERIFCIKWKEHPIQPRSGFFSPPLSGNSDLAGRQSYEHSYCYQPYMPRWGMAHASLQTSELSGGRFSLTIILRDLGILKVTSLKVLVKWKMIKLTQPPFLWPLSDCSVGTPDPFYLREPDQLFVLPFIFRGAMLFPSQGSRGRRSHRACSLARYTRCSSRSAEAVAFVLYPHPQL